jgi:hypothetical protein
LIRLGCGGWSPDVRTPVPSFLERSPALQTPVSPHWRVLRCCRGCHPFAHEKSAAVRVVKPIGEHSWCGRCGSCPTSHSLGSIRMPFWGLTSLASCAKVTGGWVCPGRPTHPLRSVTGCRAMQLRSPSRAANVQEGEMSRISAGPVRGVYVCPADPQHGQDPRCGGSMLYTSNECSSESSSRLIEHPNGFWCQLVWGWGAWGSAASSVKRAILSVRGGADSAGWVKVGGLSWYALSMERPVVCQAGATYGTCATLCRLR